LHATDRLAEADRLMTICNACRYCEGLCAVFPAMERRRDFGDGDLLYLANLCHGCGACYADCQFAPPHEFNVNVPQLLAGLRGDSYAEYAWPAAASRLFARNGLLVATLAALCIALFLLGFAAAHEPAALLAPHLGVGAFYRLMPQGLMAGLFGAAFLYAILALGLGVRNFWRASGPSPGPLWQARPLWQAIRDAGALRNLAGGGAGCADAPDRPADRRRLFHHLTFYGFLLCLAATMVATLYHYLLGREAPYPWWDVPVLLGTLGGLGLLIGPAGLFAAKRARLPELRDAPREGGDIAFLAMMFATGLSGLALLGLRDTGAMALLLALHLGIVLALFLTLPYGKFVHGLYRFAALLRSAREREQDKPSSD
jgi:citrate/tricarballylate utilization protein